MCTCICSPTRVDNNSSWIVSQYSLHRRSEIQCCVPTINKSPTQKWILFMSNTLSLPTRPDVAICRSSKAYEDPWRVVKVPRCRWLASIRFISDRGEHSDVNTDNTLECVSFFLFWFFSLLERKSSYILSTIVSFKRRPRISAASKSEI